MKTLVEKVDISITTIKNTLPQEKPVAGKFRISENCETASFVEEDAVRHLWRPEIEATDAGERLFRLVQPREEDV